MVLAMIPTMKLAWSLTIESDQGLFILLTIEPDMELKMVLTIALIKVLNMVLTTLHALSLTCTYMY